MSSEQTITLGALSNSGRRSGLAARGDARPPCFIRRATQDDLPGAFELVKEYFQAVDVWVRDTESEFSDYALGDDGGVWLAFAGEEPVGCVVLHALASPARSGEIKRLYVKPAYRRRGLAVSLLQALEEFATKTACYEWLYLDSKSDLVEAIGFYERHGYQHCDRYNSNPQATTFMRKRIG
jgi:ribosomal protein S18 acetylase RimI-like enzyme